MPDSPFTIHGDEPVEARIVSWVLGEASAFEAAELERLCEERPELLVFRRRMRALHGLLTEAEAVQPDEGWKLPPEKRKALDDIFGAEKPVRLEVEKEKRVKRSGRRAFLAIAACVVLAIVIMRLLPWEQTSEALIEIKPTGSGMSPFGDASGNRMTPQFFGTEFEKVKSRNSLEKVVENLDLASRWDMDKDDAVEKLKESIKTENVRGTDLLKIQVRQSDKKEADEIAREVAYAYKAYSDELQSESAERQLHELNKAVRNQEDKVEERRKVLATITRTKGIIHKGTDSFYSQSDADQGARSATADAEVMKSDAREEAIKRGLDAQDYADAKREFESDQELLQTMKLKQMAETISGKMAGDGVVIHEVPGAKTAPVSKTALSKSSHLWTNSPFTSKPVPAEASASIAEKKGADRPPAPSAPMSEAAERNIAGNTATAIPIPGVELATPSINYGDGDDFGNGWSGSASGGGFAERAVVAGKENDAEPTSRAARPRVVPSRDSGADKEAQVGVIREFAYPTEYEPAELPNVPGASGGAAFPVSPATPNSFIARAEGGGGALIEGILSKDANEVDLYAQAADPPANNDRFTSNEYEEFDMKAKLGRGAGSTMQSEGGLVTGGDLGSDYYVEDADNRLGYDWSMSSFSRKAAPSSLQETERLESKSEQVEITDSIPSITSGLRSGDQAISRYSVDGVLNNPNSEDDRKPGSLDVESNAKNRTAGEKTPVLGDLPQLGRLFRSGKESEDDYSDLAQREMTRRQDSVVEGDRLLMEGRDAYAKGDYQQAVEKYNQSLERIPDAPMLKDRRDSYKDHLNDASVALAMQNRKVGKYEEARKLLEDVVAADPSNESAKRELGDLDDPVRSNAALTGERAGNVDKVRRSLYTAEGNYNLGRFDEAKKSYEDTLRVDPYNAAARRGLEKVASAKSDYYRAAYDHTRSELLAQVDAAWELEVPADENRKNDGSVVTLDVPPDIAEFEGFVNYGSPILESAPTDDKTRERLMDQIDAAWKDAAPPDEKADGGLAQRQRELKVETSSLGVSEKASDTAKTKLERAAEPQKQLPAPVNPLDSMEEITASEDPYSTFSLNISDASFQVAQAALAKGEQPDPAGIKVEQFYNAVDYGDPAPSAGEPVAVSIEQAANPVIPGRNLVRVALRTAAAGRGVAQPLRLTLLVDQSGSMVREDRRAAMNKALAGLGGLLTKDDLVTVIGFSRTARLLADGLPGDKAGNLADLVNQAASEGGTNLEEAINLAEEKAMSRKLDGAQNRIVLFTDGAANLGDADPGRLAEKVKDLRQKGISFDIAGIAAENLNDELLGELSRNGNGRYYVVGKGGDDNIAKQLAGAFRPAAENVKVQVRFNPERVGHYKLIGFEKDRLKTEDFRNDAVDAAELSAEEAGVAIYQVEPLPGGKGELGDVSVRFRDTASGEMVERSWTIPYDRNAPAIDRATPSMQLAALAMFAGEKLKGGPLGEAVDFKSFTESQANVKHYYGNAGRVAEILNMVETLK